MIERIMTGTSKLRTLIWITSSKECTSLEKNSKDYAIRTAKCNYKVSCWKFRGFR